MQRSRLPAGHQPYDRLVAIRVGALAGGLLGAPVTWFTSVLWFVIGGAVVGGLGGIVYDIRRRRATDR